MSVAVRRPSLAGIAKLGGLVLLCMSIGALASSASAFAAAPVITEEFVTNVASRSATLAARLNPEGTPTTYRFEYGPSTAYEASAPVPGGDAGAGSTPSTFEVHLQDLAAMTTYHYRVMAHNFSGGGSGSTVVGVDQTFTTQSTGSEFALPDGRQWEMVSPANKHGAGLVPISRFGGVIQAAEAGGELTYVATGPVVSDPAGNTNLAFAQIFSARSPSGWSTNNINTPHNAPSGVPVGYKEEYKMFSGDLSAGLLEPMGNTPLPPLSPNAQKTVYLRDNIANSFQALVTEDNVIPGAEFGVPGGSTSTKVHILGASADLTHVVLQSSEALTPDAFRASTSNSNLNLYEWTDGRLHLVNVLPDGEPANVANLHSALGRSSTLVRNAVSDDGTRVIWEAEAAPGSYESHLYLRDTGRGATIQIDVPNAGVHPKDVQEDRPVFEGASSDGSKIFFKDTRKLTDDSHAAAGPIRDDLYVFEVSATNGPLSGRLTDLTKDTRETAGEEESADVQGIVLGYSNDGTDVYYVADGILAPGATSGECINGTGQCNLYVDHFDGKSWQTRFITSLSYENHPDWSGYGGNASTNLVDLGSRVSPSGRYLAFMSDQPLTGYDNRDVNSGASDEEVFLYDENANHSVCASCNPTGARPEGVLDTGTGASQRGLLVDTSEVWSFGKGSNSWLSGYIPGWTSVADGEARYQSRYLSDTGLLFFDSADGLVPSDVNGKEDVYEYRPEGNRCSRATQSASEVFKAEAGGSGCVALISSGTSNKESAFLDASAKGPGGDEGEDVFFLTAAQLAPQDVDSAFDIYDAHVCSTSSPCTSGVSSVPPACSNADSCRAAPAPQPSIFGASTSATFSGIGNVIRSDKISPVKPKVLTKTQRLVRALRACKKEPKRKRAGCQARARKKYGAKSKRSVASTRRGE